MLRQYLKPKICKPYFAGYKKAFDSVYHNIMTITIMVRYKSKC